MIAVVFMFLAGSISRHFIAGSGTAACRLLARLGTVFASSDHPGQYPDGPGLYFTRPTTAGRILINGLFQAVSISHCRFHHRGVLQLARFHRNPVVVSSFVGGCAGSTSGGIKVIRLLLLVKQGLRG